MFGISNNQRLGQLLQMASGIVQGNPETLYKEMYENNPEFKKFIDENKGMTLEDIATKYGIPIK